MMAEQKGVTGILIATFVILILGAALIGVISKEANAAVTKTRASQDFTIAKNGSTQSNWTVNTTAMNTVTNVPTGWKIADCPLTAFTIENSSGDALTLTTDYLVSLTYGNFTFKNTTETNGEEYPTNTTTVRYSYCANSYLNSGFGRTVLPLVGGFFALAILGVGLALFFDVGKKTGLI